MKCTDNNRKKKSYSRRRRQRQRTLRLMTGIFLALCVVAGYLIISGGMGTKQLVYAYEKKQYNKAIYTGELFAKDLCLVNGDTKMSGAPDTSTYKAAALFDVNNSKTRYAYNATAKMYPASITKIMTALVAIESADLSEEVTVEVDSSDFAADEQTCGIHKGDKLTLEALLNGLLLYSGNDNAEAIAYYIGGSIEGFADMMNKKAQELMATNTHFANPSGLHDENHYTTAYDIYLIFNECVKHKEFTDIIGRSSYTADIQSANGTTRKVTWEPTNYYATVEAKRPSGATVVGGKTGTTAKAGNCLVLLDQTDEKAPYISIVMGATSKELLYKDMSAIIDQIPNTN